MFILLATAPLSGQVWKRLDNGLPGRVTAVCRDGGYIYAAYEKTGQEHLAHIAVFNGAIWQELAPIYKPTLITGGADRYEISSLAVFKGKVYAGGRLLTGMNMNFINHLYVFDNQQWDSLYGVIQTRTYGISDMEVFNGTLVVAGEFSEADLKKASNIAAYDGSKWSYLGTDTSDEGTNGRIHDLYVHQNRLYIAGDFDKIGKSITGRIAWWNGSSWGGAGAAFQSGSSSLATYRDTLVALGYDQPGDKKYLMKFTGFGWQVMPVSIADTDDGIEYICGSGTTLFTSGNYHPISGKRLVRYYGSNGWNTVAGSESDEPSLIGITGNELLVAGQYQADLVNNIGVHQISDARLRGSVYFDQNANCSPDAGEKKSAVQLIRFTRLANGKEYYTATDSSGNYELFLPEGLYLPEVILGRYQYLPCGNAGGILVKDGQSLDKVDFGIARQMNKPDLSVGVASYSGRYVQPGQTVRYRIRVCNYGTTLAKGETVHLSHPNAFSSFSSTPSASNYSAPDATWALPDIEAGNSVWIDVYLKVPADAQPGMKFRLNTQTGSNATGKDLYKADNTDTLNLIVGAPQFSGPGFKEVSPDSIITATTEKLNYGIYFKNTSGITVKDVTVFDTVDLNLPLNTAAITATSHDPEFRVLNGSTLVWIFRDVNLPPAETNEAASRGFVEYELGIRKGLANGTQITNTATVEMDYSRSRTNTVRNTLYLGFNGIADLKSGISGMRIWPVPGNGFVNLQNDSRTDMQLQLLDCTGKQLSSFRTNAGSTYTLSTDQLAPGMYFIKSGNGGAARILISR